MRVGAKILLLAAALQVDARKPKKPDQNHIPFVVDLVPTGGTEIIVSITNKYTKDVNVFKRMSILDPNPVQKVNVTVNGL